MSEKITQKEWVLKRLKENGKITRNECLRNYISRLGAIINSLKDDGYNFRANYIKVKTFFGESRDYQYELIKD